MKIKRLNNKLTLNKKTIVDLDKTALSEVKGGIGPTHGPESCHASCITEVTCNGASCDGYYSFCC